MNKKQETNGWTPERRQNQREAIRRWQPWGSSTGPRTLAGKTRSSMNALRHGQRGAHIRRFSALIRHQQRFLALVRANIRHNIFHANELLDFVRQIPGNTPCFTPPCPFPVPLERPFAGKSP